MHPTMFRIPGLPDWLADVKSYGVMMMIAFLAGIWWACQRAIKSRGDPDVVLNVGFISLIAGIVGARAMYVIHYWDTRFAVQLSPILAAFDIRAGGLEFLGGPILTVPSVFIYLKYIARVSWRWYLDMAIPTLALGLGITRVGCFLNGCCWGAVCIDPHDESRQAAAFPWAVQFPYGSPAMNQQFAFGQITLPKELIWITPLGESRPLPRESIEIAANDKRIGAGREHLDAYKAARDKLDDLQNSGADPAELRRHRSGAAAALNKFVQANLPVGQVYTQCQKYDVTPDELLALTAGLDSKPVHPAQLYAVINGFLLAWLLSWIYYYRKRHGVLLGVFLMVYPVSRFLLELIRQDNPLENYGFGNLTISQFLGLGLILVGAAYLWYNSRLPLKCPLAVPFEPPEEDSRPPPRKKKKK